MANKFNSATHSKIQGVMNAIATAVGNSFEMDFTDSPGFEIKLTVTSDGKTLVIQGSPADQGQSNPFGTAVNGRNPRVPPVKIPGSSMP